jgi:polysaccharide biosynthesis/export protein
MQHRNSLRAPGWRLVAAILILTSISSGCAGRVFRASRLPPNLVAPSVLDLETINLSGLSDESVSAEVIQPGDVLDVTMINDFTKLTTSTNPIRVADDGTLMVPLVGRVAVGGMEIERAEQVVNNESISRGIFRHATITLTMKQCRTYRVTVTGAVMKPGTHELPRGSTSLMAALLAAEGLSKEAGTDVEIRRTDSRRALAAIEQQAAINGATSPVSFEQPTPLEIVHVNLKAAADGAIKVPDLRDGDVVHVAKRNVPPLYVMGLVVRPGSFPYPLSQEMRVLDALTLAGGVSNALAEDIVVIRRMPGAKEPARITVSLQDAKSGQDNMTLAPGDIVSVERTAATTVLDALQMFFRVSVGGNISWF